MGGVGQTLFGGSNQQQQSSSTSGNLAFPYLAGQLGPSVQALPAGTSFMGSLLGIPGYGSSSGTGTTPSPSPSPTTNPVVTGTNNYGYGSPGNYTSNPGTNIGYDGPNIDQINAMRHDGIPGDYRTAINAYNNAYHPGTNTNSQPPPTPAPTPAPTTPGTSPQQGALQTFADSGGMKFLQDNGNRMIDNNQAAKGLLGSGATLKGISDYSNSLDSTYLNQYMNNVLNFSKLGLGAAGTLTGAGAVSSGTGSGSGSSKPGLIPGAQAAAAQAAAAGG